MTNPSLSQWTFYDTELTDATGRVTYHIPESRCLSDGMYPVKMVVRYEIVFKLCAIVFTVSVLLHCRGL